MKREQVECIWPVEATLGEGPVWVAGQDGAAALYFVDIKGRKLHRCAEDGRARQSWDLPAETGFALPMDDGGLVCGMPGRLMRFAPDTGAVTPLLALEQTPDLAGNRLNDGYVDRHGSLWFGSMDNGEARASGALYRWDASSGSEAERIDGGYVITNGPAASPDGRTFYHTDTLEKTIYAYDADERGALSGKRVFVRIAGDGYPDGSTVDADGCVWVALFGGARIERYAPSGALLHTVPMPCSNITKIAFGGADLRTVFVTTARKGLSIEELSRQPLAGSVFRFRAETPGLPQHHFSSGQAHD